MAYRVALQHDPPVFQVAPVFVAGAHLLARAVALALVCFVLIMLLSLCLRFVCCMSTFVCRRLDPPVRAARCFASHSTLLQTVVLPDLCSRIGHLPTLPCVTNRRANGLGHARYLVFRLRLFKCVNYFAGVAFGHLVQRC